MPITQQRLRALIDAFNDLKQAFNYYQLQVQVLSEKHPENEELRVLAGTPMAALLTNPQRTYTTVAVESRHYNLTVNRNNYKRRKRHGEATFHTLLSENQLETYNDWTKDTSK